MTKTLNDFLEVYKPKSPDEQKFVDKHVTIKHKDRNGNGDDVFKGNTKTIKRKEERHGYDVGEDEKVYEELKGDQHKIDANKNGKIDAHDFQLLRSRKKVTKVANEEVELGEDTATDVVKANHRIMQHQQYMKNIMNADMGNPFQKVIQLRDAKKQLAALHADRQAAMAKHEEAMKMSKVKTRKKKVSEEVDLGEAVKVNKKNYSWGKMITVHQGSATSYPLHPEHQEKIRKLSDGDKTSFKDETGAIVHAHRSGDTVHLKKPGSSNRVTAVSHSHFTEEVEIDTVLDEALDLLMSIDEKTLTSAEMNKREEVVKAIKRGNPKMDKSMAYAIATKTAKRVAEERYDNEDDDGWYTHNEMHGKVSKEKWKRGWRYNHLKDKPFYHQPTKSWHHSIVATEGYMPTADEPTDANKRTAQKVRDLLAKEKKPVKRPTNEDTLDEAAVDPAKMSGGRYAQHFTVADDVSKNKDGTHTFRRGFFYKSGRTSADFAKNVSNDLNHVGIEHEVVSHGTQDYKPFRGGASVRTQNHFHATVRIKPGQKVKLDENTQIDELSKKTLGSYVSKATNQAFGKGYTGGSMTARGIITRDSEEEKAGQENVRKGIKRIDGVNKAVRKLTREEVEAIDELSKKTLSSYVQKAAGDVANKGAEYGTKKAERDEMVRALNRNKDKARGIMKGWIDAKTADTDYVKPREKAMKRLRGIDRAAKKLAKEETQIDELSKKTLGSYVNKAANRASTQGVIAGLKIARDENSRKNFDKMDKRRQGISRAVDKLTKEEVEAIDELSKKTLSSYVKRAAVSAANQAHAYGVTKTEKEWMPRGLQPLSDKNIKKLHTKADRRLDGISNAAKRLTKEDIINRTIEKYVPEDMKFTPEERLLKRLNGLSEGHIDTLLGLFEALNSDNQNKMIETVESHEGVNQLLNFALENKGE
jgi:hypothetical protein